MVLVNGVVLQVVSLIPCISYDSCSDVLLSAEYVEFDNLTLSDNSCIVYGH